MKKLFAMAGILSVLAACSNPEPVLFDYTADSAGHASTPASISITMNEIPESVCLQTNTSDERIPAQIEPQSGSNVTLWWFHNQPAGETVSYTVLRDDDCPSGGYAWNRLDDDSIQLSLDGNPLLQYEHPAYSSEDIENTKKPFHHLFDPATDQLITKGPGGLYSHHRGIFYGYNKVRHGDDEIDIWHALNGERSEHSNILEEMQGPVFGGHLVEIHWKDTTGGVWLEEEREMRVTALAADNYIVDLDSRLTSVAGEIGLGGDLQHAGVQFRAAQYVADHAETTRFIRPENWSDFPDNEELDEENWENVPWNAIHFELENGSYTVVYMSHAENPGPSQMSERTYGRFGEFIPYELSDGETLHLRYRFWVISGNAPSVQDIDEMYSVYVNE